MSSSHARQVLATFDTDDKIGQILSTAVGHHAVGGVNAAEEEADVINSDVRRVAEEITEYRLGGVCYFPGRPDGQLPDEVAAITGALQDAAPLPLLISVDQEGGQVARMRRGFSLFGSAMAMGALNDPAAVRQAARISAEEMRAVGVNHIFAPTADVNSNPANPVIGIRSFGADPAAVAALVTEVVAGYHEGGVAATVKHFPGHGDTATDSHLGLPVLERAEENWRVADRPPFEAAIAAGVDAVMGGHLVLRFADDEPATYSHRILTGLLRDELGFTGLCCSDALEMEGAVGDRDQDELVVDALLAGVDQLLMPRSIPGAVAALRRAVDEGRVPMERLDEACLRVLALKEARGLLGEAEPEKRSRVRVGRELAFATELARRSVTVRGSVESVKPGTNVLMVGDHTLVKDLRAALEERGCWITVAGPERWTDDELPTRAAGFDSVFVVTRDAWKSPDSNPPVADLLDAVPAAQLIAAGTPYDASNVPEGRGTWMTYGLNSTQAAGLAIALTDLERAPEGVLPVGL